MTGQGATGSAPPNPVSRRAQLEAMRALQRRLNQIKPCRCPEDCRAQGRDPTPEEEDNNNNNNNNNSRHSHNDPRTPSNNPRHKTPTTAGGDHSGTSGSGSSGNTGGATGTAPGSNAGPAPGNQAGLSPANQTGNVVGTLQSGAAAAWFGSATKNLFGNTGGNQS